ncbi:hypothetical protein VPH35_110523 [Triticum aestivum]
MDDSGDEAERRRHARSDRARPPSAFNRCELEDFDIVLAYRRRASSGNWSAARSSSHGSVGCSSAGASSSLVPEELLERSAREQEEMEERIWRELEYERLFFETGVTVSQAHASKEADMRVMKAEQAKLYIDLASDSSDSD